VEDKLMAKYKAIPYNKGWKIQEDYTHFIVGKTFFEDQAKDTVEFLEKGTVFNGFTPHFFTDPTFNLDYKLGVRSRH
jgi:hypothetical protein